MAPNRKSDFAEVVIRALITGFVTSLVNACVAGILFVPRDVLDCISYLNSSSFNGTSADLQTCCHSLYESVVPFDNGTFTFEGQWSNVNQSFNFFNNCCNLYNNSVTCKQYF